MLDEELVHAYLIILPANRVPQGGKWALPISKPAGGGYQIFVLRIDDFGIHQYSLGLTVRPQHESCATDRSPSLSGYLLHQIIYLMPREGYYHKVIIFGKKLKNIRDRYLSRAH